MPATYLPVMLPLTPASDIVPLPLNIIPPAYGPEILPSTKTLDIEFCPPASPIIPPTYALLPPTPA